MRRAALEHIIRAATQIADDNELMIFGSQAILGEFPNAPTELLVSDEADVFPKNHPERADLIDGSIGEGSAFHDTFGYDAQGIGEETAVLPGGWKDRLVVVSNANTLGATGYCLECHDLLVAKYVAGRDKDRRFARDVFRFELASPETVRVRLAHTPISDAQRAQIEAWTMIDASGPR